MRPSHAFTKTPAMPPLLKSVLYSLLAGAAMTLAVYADPQGLPRWGYVATTWLLASLVTLGYYLSAEEE